MPHRPPLTAARLAELYDQEPTDVVLELLWEIHRLRATVLRAYQVRRILRHAPAAVPIALWEAFTRELDTEPCLRDPPTPKATECDRPYEASPADLDSLRWHQAV